VLITSTNGPEFMLQSVFSRGAPVVVGQSNIRCIACDESVLSIAGIVTGSHIDNQDIGVNVECLCKGCEISARMIGIGNFQGTMGYLGLGHTIPKECFKRSGNHYTVSTPEYRALKEYGGDDSVIGMNREDVVRIYCARYLVKTILSVLDGKAGKVKEKEMRRMSTILCIAILRKRKKFTNGEVSLMYRFAPQRMRENLYDEFSMVCYGGDLELYKKPILAFIDTLVKKGPCTWLAFDQCGGTIPKLDWAGSEKLFFGLVDWLFLNPGS